MSEILSGALSVVIMLIILSVLITVHEFGHFIMARLCGIRVREFAIGMGPAFFKRRKKNEAGEPVGTLFSLRVFPIGGYCDMSEDEESDDPSHFRNKKNRQKFLVLFSGALMNFLIGIVLFITMFILMIGGYHTVPTVGAHLEGFPYADSLRVGDRIVSVDGHVIMTYTDLSIFLDRGSDTPYTFIIDRNGERRIVTGIQRLVDDVQEDGTVRKIIGFHPGYEKVTFPIALREGFVESIDSVRIVWLSLGDLFSGKAGVTDMMGPVAMGGVVNDVITQEGTEETPIPLTARIRALLSLAGLIAVNLAIVNLLPVPALDGGRIVFLFLSWALVKIRKRPLSAKIEGYIHGVTMLLLFGLMIFVFFNDIRRLVGL